MKLESCTYMVTDEEACNIIMHPGIEGKVPFLCIDVHPTSKAQPIAVYVHGRRNIARLRDLADIILKATPGELAEP
jgi:hypothetical protein